MNVIGMLAVATVVVTNQPPAVSLVSKPPKERMEWRVRRSREMMAALRVDEARREAFMYERRKRTLNRAAAEFQRVSGPSNAVVSVTVDYRTGDIRLEYADGYRFVQRYTPPPTNEVRRIVRPGPSRRKAEGD